MQYAIERRQGKLVDADEVNAYGLERYICPVCKESVFLRRGVVRRAHFAHRPSEGDRECENYHPGGEYLASASVTPQPKKPQPLPLFISVDDLGGGRLRWRLALLIPYNVEISGFVLVEHGISGRARVDLSSLAQGGRRIPVRNQTEPYIASLIGTAEDSYRGRFAAPVPGLDGNYGNVFRYGERGGRRLDPDHPLYWGRGYYVVWSRTLTPTWPAAVYVRRLNDIGPWQGACIEMPPDEDEIATKWADDFLAREVRRPPVTISVVSPMTHRLPDDSLAVEEGSDAIVAVTREHGAVMPSELRVAWPGLRAVEGVPLKNEDRILVNLGRVPRGTSIVALSDGEEDEVILVGRQDLNVGVPKPAGLRVRDEMKQILLIPAYSPSAGAALEAAKKAVAGGVTVLGISLPLGLRCTLTYRESNTPESEVRQFSWPDDWAAGDITKVQQELEDKVCRQLVTALGRADHLELDFGSFGGVRLSPVSTTRAASRRHLLPLQLRQRLRWLASFPDSYGQSRATVEWPTSFSLILSSASARMRLEDAALLGSVVSRQSWPTKLAPHVRALRTEVCVALGLAP